MAINAHYTCHYHFFPPFGRMVIEYATDRHAAEWLSNLRRTDAAEQYDGALLVISSSSDIDHQ